MSTSRSLSVLYVDDDPDICAVVHAALSLIAGLDVHIAHSGEHAIDRAFELRPDLILMDVMMPHMDGPTTLQQMRTTPLIADIPVIFLTAKVLPPEVAHFRQLGALGVIGKPFDPLTLGAELLALWKPTGAGPRETGLSTGNSPDNDSDGDGDGDGEGSLIERFLERTRGHLVRLDTLIQSALADGAALTEVEHICHSIHGAAAMFGFPSLSAAAGAIERRVEQRGRNTAAIGSVTHIAAMQHLLDLTQKLGQELDKAERGKPGPEGMFQGGDAGQRTYIPAAPHAVKT